MNGKKMYALLGSLTIALSCVTSAVVAKDAQTTSKPADKTAGKASTTGTGFNELKQQSGPKRSISTDALLSAPTLKKKTLSDMDNGADKRSVALDSLFAAFKSEEKQTVQVSHSTVKTIPSVHHKATVKTASAPTAKRPAKTSGGSAETALAVYKHANAGVNNVAAVSHSVISNSMTNVIQASLDKPGVMPKYRSGEHMIINLKALQDCNVMVFDYDNKGTITQLYPNEYDKNGSMHAGDTVEIGGENSNYTLDVDGNGPEQIFVYAYPSTEKLEVAMAPVANSPFRSAKITREQYDRLIAQSREYFAPETAAASDDRGIKISAKQNGAQNVSVTTRPANKLQLVFEIEK